MELHAFLTSAPEVTNEEIHKPVALPAVPISYGLKNCVSKSIIINKRKKTDGSTRAERDATAKRKTHATVIYQTPAVQPVANHHTEIYIHHMKKK
jgi:hypothetical protein